MTTNRQHRLGGFPFLLSALGDEGGMVNGRCEISSSACHLKEFNWDSQQQQQIEASDLLYGMDIAK